MEKCSALSTTVINGQSVEQAKKKTLKKNSTITLRGLKQNGVEVSGNIAISIIDALPRFKEM